MGQSIYRFLLYNDVNIKREQSERVIMISCKQLNASTTFSGIQSAQRDSHQQKPVLKGLERDTISFKADERLFLEQIAKLCKKGLNSDVEGLAQAYAHSVDKTDPRIVAERARIEADRVIKPYVKKFILEEIWPEIGKGGVKDLGAETPVTRFLNRVFGG